jgi:hypothetical protein
VIYDAVYPSEDWAPISFEKAQRQKTIHYRQAIEAALLARPVLTDRAEQLSLVGCGPRSAWD